MTTLHGIHHFTREAGGRQAKSFLLRWSLGHLCQRRAFVQPHSHQCRGLTSVWRAKAAPNYRSSPVASFQLLISRPLITSSRNDSKHQTSKDAETTTTSSAGIHREGHEDSSRRSTRKAIHELEHRAKHASILITEKLVSSIDKRAGERLAQRAGESVAEKASERLALRTGVQLAERTGERLAERAGESVVERAGERLAERTGVRLAERAGESVPERAVERLAERTGERLAGRAGESLAERAGERLAERTGERLAGASTIVSVASKSGRHMVIRRIGRGALIAVPMLGGVFALYILKLDLTRAHEEWRRQKLDFVWPLFTTAALSDGIDAICHFTMAYAIYEGLGHHLLQMIETASLIALSVLLSLLSEVKSVANQSTHEP